jgi:hypothetical protein
MKQIVIVPIYWGDWWVPARGSPYNWAEVNGLLQTVVGGRYMDCLNQYGIGRGVVSKTYVYPLGIQRPHARLDVQNGNQRGSRAGTDRL